MASLLTKKLQLPVNFAGAWQVRRKLIDYRAKTTAMFEGSAEITRDGFLEQGTARVGEMRFKATRAYQLGWTDAGVTVALPDGGEFIGLGAGSVQRVVHHCGDDLYIGRFFFADADHWAEHWRVSGPRKHYASVGHFTRAAR